MSNPVLAVNGRTASISPPHEEPRKPRDAEKLTEIACLGELCAAELLDGMRAKHVSETLRGAFIDAGRDDAGMVLFGNATEARPADVASTSHVLEVVKQAWWNATAHQEYPAVAHREAEDLIDAPQEENDHPEREQNDDELRNRKVHPPSSFF